MQCMCSCNIKLAADTLFFPLSSQLSQVTREARPNSACQLISMISDQAHMIKAIPCKAHRWQTSCLQQRLQLL